MHQVAEISPDTRVNINITNLIITLNPEFPIYRISGTVSGISGADNVIAKGPMTVSWLDSNNSIQTYHLNDTYVMPQSKVLLLSNRVRKQGIIFDSANEQLSLKDKENVTIPVTFSNKYVFRLPTIIHQQNATLVEGNSPLAKAYNEPRSITSKEKTKLTVADLCGGIGVATHVFEEEGHTVSVYADKNYEAVTQYMQCYPSNSMYTELLSTLSDPHFNQATTDTDLVVMGTPCEDFSTLNVSRNPQSERACFTLQSLDLILKKEKYKMVLLENVSSMLSHKPFYDEFKYIIEKYNYVHHEHRANSWHYSSVQSRPRSYHVITRRDVYTKFGYCKINATHQKLKIPPATLDDILAPVEQARTAPINHRHVY